MATISLDHSKTFLLLHIKLNLTKKWNFNVILFAAFKCDQIGFFWKVFPIKFCRKLAQIFTLLYICYFLSKNCHGYCLGNFWNNGLLLFSTSSHTAPTESYVPFTHTPKVGTIDQSGQEANFCWMNLVGRVNIIGRSIKGIVVETSRQKSLKKNFSSGSQFWPTIYLKLSLRPAHTMTLRRGITVTTEDSLMYIVT